MKQKNSITDDTTSDRSIKRIISGNEDVIASLFLCLIALAVALLLKPSYETNDDSCMELLLFGYPGMQGTSFLVFINRILGLVLFSLVSVFPRVNWYFLMHYSVCLISLFVLARTFIRKFKLKGFFASLIIVAAGMETLTTVQFTKTAAIAAIAGCIGLMHFLREKKTWITKSVCIGLIVMASMIRFESLEMVSPFLGVIGLYELVKVFRKRREDIKKYAVVFTVTVSLIVSCIVIDNTINKNTPGISEFYEYNECRVSLSDYPEDKASFTDSIESQMVANWMNNDPEVFTLQKMREIRKPNNHKEKLFNIKSLKDLFETYFPNAVFAEPLLIVALAESMCFLAFSKRRFYIFPMLFFYFGMEWYLSSVNRLFEHRVDFGILLALVVSLIYLSDVQIPETAKKYSKYIRYGIVPAVTFLALVVVCNGGISRHLNEHNHYYGTNRSLKEATSNPEYQYMVHPLIIGPDKERNLYDIPTDQPSHHYFVMGGWQNATDFPGLQVPKLYNIEGDPWKTCVDSNTIKLIFPNDDRGIMAEAVAERYISKKSGKKCTGILEYQNVDILVYRIVSTD